MSAIESNEPWKTRGAEHLCQQESTQASRAREPTHPFVVLAVEQVNGISPVVVVCDGKDLARVVKRGDRFPAGL